MISSDSHVSKLVKARRVLSNRVWSVFNANVSCLDRRSIVLLFFVSLRKQASSATSVRTPKAVVASAITS